MQSTTRVQFYKDLLSGKDKVDFMNLKYSYIFDIDYQHSFGRKKKITDQLQMLYREFSGQSEILFLHAAIIIFIRREINLNINILRFKQLWSEHRVFLLEILDLRWMISACDTLVDISESTDQRQIAYSSVLVANIVKLYETERLALEAEQLNNHSNQKNSSIFGALFSNHKRDNTQLSQKQSATRFPTTFTPLFDGVSAYMVGRGDMIKNLLGRADCLLESNTVESSIFIEIINRLLKNQTILSRLNFYQKGNKWKPFLLNDTPLDNESDNTDLTTDHSNGYLLLNDTMRLSKGYHIGTATVTQTIRNELYKRQFHELGWANDRVNFEKLLDKFSKQISVVILNGEGTLHHGSARGQELLDCCCLAKAKGIPIVLINSVWEKNPDTFNNILEKFDLVFVRDSYSHSAAKDFCNPHITHDISFLLFSRLFKNNHFHPPNMPLGIIDNVIQSKANCLQDFSTYKKSPYYCMPFLPLTRLRERAIDSLAPSTSVPSILKLSSIATCDKWLTGRFHGLIAVICAQKPVCAIKSNTKKIEGLLTDIGIRDLVLLNDSWTSLPLNEQDEMLQHRLGLWNKSHWMKVNNFIEFNEKSIQNMFDTITKSFN